MKIIVAICVYNRFDNIKLWINCWQQSEQHNAELVIIHNHYGDEKELQKLKIICDINTIKYVPRNGLGFDIGAFQDVCRERLDGFPDYDILLWCCDDTIPMSKDFLSPFINKLTNDTGVVCMEISPFVKKHIRTTGFAIRKEIANKLVFPADPVITKEHCYQFEHRSKNIFYNQIINMGLRVVMADMQSKSPLWDMGYHRRLNRQAEHDEVFNSAKVEGDKVAFICPIYDMFPQIISSLICQTHQNWELILIHNGPLNRKYDIPKDSRIKFIINPVQTGKWGHPLRKWALNEIKEGRLSDADYIVITNADNYHIPTYTEYLLKGFKKSHTAVATFCSSMVHSYKAWEVIPCRFARGFIDCAGVMVKKDVAVEIGWRDVDGHSSDWTYFSDIAAKYSIGNFIAVRGCLLVHN